MLSKKQIFDLKECEQLSNDGIDKDCMVCSCNVCIARENAAAEHKKQDKSIEENFLKALRKIDTHIRATKDSIPYIVETLKNILPEYHD